jgi:hypothetical protein
VTILACTLSCKECQVCEYGLPFND